MQEFTQAITTAMTASPIVAAFPGGFRFGRMPEGTAYPYLVASIVAAPVTTVYGGVEFYEPTIRFTAWGIGLNTMLANMETVTTALDEATITLPSGVELNTIRKSEPTPRLDDEVDGQGQEIWRVDVVYAFAISA